jgi:hypothetical protein
VKQKVALKYKKKLRTQITGKFNDISSADGKSLNLKTIRMQYIYSTTKGLEFPTVCFCLAHPPMLLYEHMYLFLLCFSEFFSY